MMLVGRQSNPIGKSLPVSARYSCFNASFIDGRSCSDDFIMRLTRSNQAHGKVATTGRQKYLQTDARAGTEMLWDNFTSTPFGGVGGKFSKINLSNSLKYAIRAESSLASRYGPGKQSLRSMSAHSIYA
ncbi:MAG: hypothetical protein Q9169_000778 [Polycauliona sp. 2 TL-2023]